MKKGVDKGLWVWYSIQAVTNDSTAEVLRQAVFRFGAANAAMKKLKKVLDKRNEMW